MQLTDKQRQRVERRLTKAGFKNIAWDRDVVSADHAARNKAKRPSIGTYARELGFYVPCCGIAGNFYAQVWQQNR